MQGWLWRKWTNTTAVGQRQQSKWTRRFFVLDGPFLYCFEDKLDAKVFKKERAATWEGAVALKDCCMSCVVHHKRQHCFAVFHSERRGALFAADSELLKLRWVSTLHRASQG